MPRDFQLKGNLPFDNLEINKECTLTHITQHRVKCKERFDFKVQGDNSIYRANPVLEEYLQNNNNRLLLKSKALDLTYKQQSKHEEIPIKPTKTVRKHKIKKKNI